MATAMTLRNPLSLTPTIGAVLPTGGGASQDRANIDYLLNPYFNTSEVETNAAEQSLGQGTIGSGFASGTRGRLLESEKINRFQLGHQMLEPYLNREFQGAQAEADRASRLNEIAAQGAQAMQQLQLEEAGQTARASSAERAALERAILQGQQAMQQLTLQEAGQTGRSNASIAGNLANTRLNILGNLASDAMRRPQATTTPSYITDFDWTTQTHSTRPNPAATPTGGGMSSIDSILRRYGLLN